MNSIDVEHCPACGNRRTDPNQLYCESCGEILPTINNLISGQDDLVEEMRELKEEMNDLKTKVDLESKMSPAPRSLSFLNSTLTETQKKCIYIISALVVLGIVIGLVLSN